MKLSNEFHPIRTTLMPTDEELEQEFNRNHDWIVFEDEDEDETEVTKTLLTRLGIPVSHSPTASLLSTKHWAL